VLVSFGKTLDPSKKIARKSNKPVAYIDKTPIMVKTSFLGEGEEMGFIHGAESIYDSKQTQKITTKTRNDVQCQP
jgi:hypothetical protein